MVSGAPRIKNWIVGFALLAGFGVVWAAESDRRDSGRRVSVAPPAKRIVTLAPHLTELVFAAGAGGKLVGVSEHSDYPDAARRIPRIGNSHGLDVEAIVAMRPDVVLAWSSGNPDAAVERLRRSGLVVYSFDISRLTDVPDSIESIGRLAGTGAKADAVASALRARLSALLKKFENRKPRSVFIQVLDESLLTLNGKHLVSEVLRVCGARNVFETLPSLVSRVSIEAVVQANPEHLVMSGPHALSPVWESRWKAWPQLAAVRSKRLHYMDADLLHRAGPRMFDGAEILCEQLASAD